MSLYSKKQGFPDKNHQFILLLKYEKLESSSSGTLTVFEDIGPSGFDNFAQPPIFTIAFCEPFSQS